MESYGILSDRAIRAALEEGTIKIDPFNPAHVNPASYDLTLGAEVAVYKLWVETYRNEPQPRVQDGSRMRPLDNWLDVKKEPEVEKFEIDPERGWVLKPGMGYLMHTRERIWTESYVPIVDGKSSIGRLFIQIHATAGYGDPGFDGQYTLEVIVQHPVKVYPGMRIGQIRFHTLSGELEKNYKQTGHYKGDAAKGAVGSQAWKQFKRL